jgi:SAM-dependent methyltransferase
MPLTDDFITPSQFGQEFRANIGVHLCSNCLTVQTQHNVDVSDYYEDYHYSVGESTTVSSFMRALATNLKARYYPRETSVKVLEIGSGDGGQLVAFRDTGCTVLGYEPSSLLCDVAESKGVPTIQGLFDSSSAAGLPEEFRTVDVVMLSYTFDHLPEPRQFLAACRSILDEKRGLLVVEIHDLEKIIERQEYCLFEHEHSIYLTERTAANLCQLEGFKIIDFHIVPESERRGNSLLFVATPEGSKFASQRAEPQTSGLFNDPAFYDNVEGDIHRGIRNLEAFTERSTRDGQTLAGYGAGGRGVMTLAAMENSRRVSYLVDRNPKREGLLAPKSGVPLVGLDELRKNPVENILVFSFGYMGEITEALGPMGYSPPQLHSLLDVLAGRY